MSETTPKAGYARAVRRGLLLGIGVGAAVMALPFFVPSIGFAVALGIVMTLGGIAMVAALIAYTYAIESQPAEVQDSDE